MVVGCSSVPVIFKEPCSCWEEMFDEPARWGPGLKDLPNVFHCYINNYSEQHMCKVGCVCTSLSGWSGPCDDGVVQGGLAFCCCVSGRDSIQVYSESEIARSGEDDAPRSPAVPLSPLPVVRAVWISLFPAASV